MQRLFGGLLSKSNVGEGLEEAKQRNALDNICYLRPLILRIMKTLAKLCMYIHIYALTFVPYLKM